MKDVQVEIIQSKSFPYLNGRWGVFHKNTVGTKTIVAAFDNKAFAQRFAGLLNDTPINWLKQCNFEQATDAENCRIAEISELFRRQENLTWADFGFVDEDIHRLTRYLEIARA